jgi:hypothetical protein
VNAASAAPKPKVHFAITVAEVMSPTFSLRFPCRFMILDSTSQRQQRQLAEILVTAKSGCF